MPGPAQRGVGNRASKAGIAVPALDDVFSAAELRASRKHLQVVRARWTNYLAKTMREQGNDGEWRWEGVWDGTEQAGDIACRQYDG